MDLSSVCSMPQTSKEMVHVGMFQIFPLDDLEIGEVARQFGYPA